MADFLNESEGGAAVFVCGARAMLTFSDVSSNLGGQRILLTHTRLEELLWQMEDHHLHVARGFVHAACCDILAAVARERVYLIASAQFDTTALRRAESTCPRAARFVCSALARHSGDPGVIIAALRAVTPLIQLQTVVRHSSAPVEASAAEINRAATASRAPPSLISAADLQSLQLQIRRTVEDCAAAIACHSIHPDQQAAIRQHACEAFTQLQQLN